MRSLPGQENSPVVANGTNLVGANIMTPSGIAIEPAARQDQRLLARLVGRHLVVVDADVSLAMRCTAGFAVRKESGPPSTMKVPCSLLDDLAGDLAAEAVVLLEQHEVDVVPRRRRRA